jgi:hypothetical protein
MGDNNYQSITKSDIDLGIITGIVEHIRDLDVVYDMESLFQLAEHTHGNLSWDDVPCVVRGWKSVTKLKADDNGFDLWANGTYLCGADKSFADAASFLRDT